MPTGGIFCFTETSGGFVGSTATVEERCQAANATIYKADPTSPITFNEFTTGFGYLFSNRGSELVDAAATVQHYDSLGRIEWGDLRAAMEGAANAVLQFHPFGAQPIAIDPEHAGAAMIGGGIATNLAFEAGGVAVGAALSRLAKLGDVFDITGGMGEAFDQGVKEEVEATAARATGKGDAPRRVHSTYADDVRVYEGEQPKRLPTEPDPEAAGPHTRLRWDDVNGRVYQGREFSAEGYRVRDVDFTSPTFPSGKARPDHIAPPHQHIWRINNPRVGPKSGFIRGPGEPLR